MQYIHLTSICKTFTFKIVSILVLSLLLVGCGAEEQPQVTGAGVLQRIENLSRLETVRYRIETVVQLKREGEWGMLNIGGQEILMVVNGTVTAGVDFDKLNEDSITVSEDGNAITMELPAVEILSSSVGESEVYNFEAGAFTELDPAFQEEARSLGSVQIQQVACRDEIFQRANENAQQEVRQLLELSGFESVDIVTAPVPECPVEMPDEEG